MDDVRPETSNLARNRDERLSVGCGTDWPGERWDAAQGNAGLREVDLTLVGLDSPVYEHGLPSTWPQGHDRQG